MNRLPLLFSIFVFVLPTACGETQTPQFDNNRAWAHLVKQCDFGPRLPGSPARDSTTFYLTRTLVGYGAEVSTQRFDINDPYADRFIPMVNVFASFYPERKRRVLLAAHYDSRPWADQEEDDSLKVLPVLGANDGASGVAVILEIGRLIAEHDPGDIGVDLVFFDGEDYGKEQDLDYYLLGSKYFVSVRPDYRPVCGLLFDMVASEASVFAREGYSRTHALELTDDIFARAERLGYDFFKPIDAGPIYDDHVPFLMAGIQMIDIFGFEYPYWHTVNDTPENCSAERMGQIGTLALDFLYNFPF